MSYHLFTQNGIEMRIFFKLTLRFTLSRDLGVTDATQ